MQAPEPQMPIMFDRASRDDPTKRYLPIGSVPIRVLDPYRRRAFTNHSQSLERLAARGGLSPCELVAILEDRRWHAMDAGDAQRRLSELLEVANGTT